MRLSGSGPRGLCPESAGQIQVPSSEKERVERLSRTESVLRRRTNVSHSARLRRRWTLAHPEEPGRRLDARLPSVMENS